MKTGDVVLIRGTDAPPMTAEVGDDGKARVLWFWNGRLRQAIVDACDLELVA